MTGFGIFGVAILTGLIQLTSVLGSCPAGMFGDSCSYFCHCGTSCNETTGACSDPCDAGWTNGGSMCQKQNIALNKSASITSGSATTWSPQKAVDGNSDIDGENTTCFVAGGSPSDWTVDLGRDFQLYDIRIYSMRNYYWTNANSTIYLNNDNGTICYTFPSQPATTNETDVTCNGTSRYVTIRNPGTESGFNDSLNICEVEIYVCSQNLYGENCDMFCHCLNSTCDRWTGVCPGDCRPGWQGTRCDTECDSNHYGSNCRGVCSSRHCVGNSSCDSKGTCLSGCETGWARADCTACQTGRYGSNCSKSCDSRHCGTAPVSCDHVTGACAAGCQEGWIGADCTQRECLDDFTGDEDVRVSPVTSGVIGGAVVLVVMMLLIGGLMMCLLKSGRLKWISPPGTSVRNKDTGGTIEIPAHANTSGRNEQDYTELSDVTREREEKSQYDVIQNKVYENNQI